MESRWAAPLLREVNERRRKLIAKRFPYLEGCKHDAILSLYRHLERCPECFYSREHFSAYLEWLDSQRRSRDVELRAYLQDNCAELSSALLLLAEVNVADWHDSTLGSGRNEFETIRLIDAKVHPAYLRLVEAVLFPFIRLIAAFNRLSLGKSLEGLDVFNAVAELRSAGMSDLVSSYDHTVRNGIGHGGITYLQGEIEYRDKRGNAKVLSDRDMLRLFDDLLDTCNGMALGLRVFLTAHLAAGYSVPAQVFLEELQAETDCPWWRIEGCIPSVILGGRKQLIIYVWVGTPHLDEVRYSAVATAALAARFAPGYDRYFLSLHSRRAWPGWAAFDGTKLAEVSTSGAGSPVDYVGAFENLFFHAPGMRLPRPLRKVATLARSFKVHWPMVLSDIRSQLGLAYLEARTASLHRNGRRSVLNGSVVISSDAGSVDQNLVRESRRRIIRVALAAARRATPRTQLARYLPLGWARVAVFRRNHRKRRLAGFGLGSDLIGTVQISHIARIRRPDILGSTIETLGPFRIAWNSAWLQEEPTRDS